NGGVQVSQSASLGFPVFSIAPDGAAGVYCVWQSPEPSNPSTSTDLLAQRLDASGVRQWSDAGRNLSNAPGQQLGPAIAADGGGGAIVAWKDARSDAGDIYAQNIHRDGTLGGQIVGTEVALVRAQVSDGVVSLEWFKSGAAGRSFSLLRS